MATKTISIDLEAYRRLTDARRNEESFSRVIRRVVVPSFDLDAYLTDIAAHPLDVPVARAIERHERARHLPTSRAR